VTGRYLALHDDTGTPLLVLDDGGDDYDTWAVTKVDLGSPEVREQVTNRTWADGTVDRSAWVGARGITVEATAVGGQPAVEALRAWCHPARRPWLHIDLPTWPAPRRIQVRGVAITGDLTAVQPDVQAQWKAPAGLMEDISDRVVQVWPAVGTEPGMREQLSFPFQFPPGGLAGAAELVVEGTAPAWPVIDVYGPMVAPVLHHLGTDALMSFPLLTIAAGDFLRIDMGARTITSLGDPGASRYSALDFSTSSWWSLSPGVERVSLTCATAGAGSMALFRWRSRWL
jgi:hypothetical protein